MTVPAATFQSYSVKGLKEDISDMIFDISPTEKPFTSAVRKTKATQSKHQWQTDALAAASPTASAIVEGDDLTRTRRTRPSFSTTSSRRCVKACLSLARSGLPSIMAALTSLNTNSKNAWPSLAVTWRPR